MLASMSVLPSFRLSTSISSRPLGVHPGLDVDQSEYRFGELARRFLGQVVTDNRDETPLVAPREEALVGRGGRGRAHPVPSPWRTMVGTAIRGCAASRTSMSSTAGSPGASAKRCR